MRREELKFRSFSNYSNALVYPQLMAYDLKTGKKEELHPMQRSRCDHTSVSMGDSIYVLGGCDGTVDMSSCERYVQHQNEFYVHLEKFLTNNN